MRLTALLLLPPLLTFAAVVVPLPRKEDAAYPENDIGHRIEANRLETVLQAPRPTLSSNRPSPHHHELHKRQFWNYVGSGLQKTLPGLIQWVADNITWVLSWQEYPLSKTMIKPVINEKAHKAIFKYGPWSLGGSEERPKWFPVIQMDPKSTVIIRTLKGLPANASIISAKPALVFEDGTPADYSKGIYIHHFLIADVSKPSAPFALCPNMHKEETIGLWTAGYVLEAVGAGLIQVGQDAVGNSNTYQSKSPNVKSAFLTNSNDLFGLQAEIVNYNPTNRTVYFTLELEYLDYKPDDFLDASTITLSATGCMPPGYRPPKQEKQYNYTSEPFDVSQNGYIINARGHLHDGGSKIELWLNNTMVCQSLPTYSRPKNSAPNIPETILKMSWCNDPVRIRKGDKLRVVSYYDLDLHPLRLSSLGEETMHRQGHGSIVDGTSQKNGGSGHDMEGMEEMGIMTTNFAWEIPSEMKSLPSNDSSIFDWLDSARSPRPSPKPLESKPAIPIPSVYIPKVSIPPISIPPISIPPVSIPSISIPMISIPSISIPGLLTPGSSYPGNPVTGNPNKPGPKSPGPAVAKPRPAAPGPKNPNASEDDDNEVDDWLR